MKAKVSMATFGAAAATLAAAVVWTAPSASAGTDYCNALPPKDARDCNCGFDFAPGSPELQQCLSGNSPAPGPAQP
ncbi:hypothetical protein AWB90_04150 [Mycobacterium paraense]|uniref:Uncharacterized protein n=1 Tax=Mycobacterium paraense TaxID=767916 RepID=A0A1X2AKN2_9MYCO|nr:hypothetical protein AWB90_04150 [Mycobacterium paraense]